MADNQHYVIDDGQNKIPGYSKEETDAAIDAAASNLTNLAAAFSESATYAVGDWCIYNGVLYQCKQAITTAGAWRPTYWDAKTVSDGKANIERGYWTPHIYDGDIKTQEIPQQKYYKIGDIYVMPIYVSDMNFITPIQSMLQIRNTPCNTIFGGTFFLQGISGQGGGTTIQTTFSGRVYIRPNVTVTAGSKAVLSMIIFGANLQI